MFTPNSPISKGSLKWLLVILVIAFDGGDEVPLVVVSLPGVGGLNGTLPKRSSLIPPFWRLESLAFGGGATEPNKTESIKHFFMVFSLPKA